MQLNDKQKKHLRSLAHDLKPVIQVGTGGISAGLASELNQTLEHHELIKAKVRVGDRDARNAAIDAMVTKSNACLVARIGNTAILYRRREKNPGIELP
ncbi:MAG: ribosome assembly RNA-binding protein YhbY [Chromatiales bacterium]|jgi:RNA-binding protein|nr:ribosome assembly RNA-binding protein YhbY [Chromatiales bacterium]